MKKILLRVAAGIGVFILLIWIGLVVITIAYGDKIKSIAVAELNKRLNTEVKVNGAITFSLFSHFPSAAVNFNQVVVKETLSEKNDLLSCNKISFLFNIWNLFSSSYVIQKVTAQDGTLSVRINADGVSNYAIFKQSNHTSSDFSLKINEADLENFSVLYFDEKNRQYYSFKTNDAQLKGDFSASKFSLGISADAFSNFFKSGTTDFLPGRNVYLEGTIECDLNKQEYLFHDASLHVNGNKFRVNGSVTNLDEGNNLQLKISSDQLKFEELISLLPQEYSKKYC